MNRRALLLLWSVLALLAPLLPRWIAEAAPRDESPRTVTFDIDARLVPEHHVVDGRATLTWRNDSPVPVSDIHLHLYLNAFRDMRTTFMRESRGSHRRARFNPARPGGIELAVFRQEGSEANLRERGEFIQPNDGNADDQTVLRIPLATPIAAGATGTFRLEWRSKLPQVFARTGHARDFHMVAQWFPKPGVWEQATEGDDTSWHWNCHQFHGNSEFYSHYGSYRVRIVVPERYEGKVGASGKRVGTTHGEDGTITYEHVVDDVHDFAWVAGLDFQIHTIEFGGGAGTSPEEQAYVAQVLGREVHELDLPPVTVHFLLQPEHADQLERHRKAIWHALTYMGFWFGPYPYPTLTVVDPDHRGRDAGGMEYPTLITGGTRIVRPERRLSPEGVLVHEFGHQHFYGLIGTNEFETAWMDEGMTTWSTAKTLMRAYPPSENVSWYAGYPLYSEAPLEFPGIAAHARTAMGPLPALFDEHLKLPFGNLGVVRDLAGALGVNHPPEEIGLWSTFGEVRPLSFLRELPTLSHVKPLGATPKQWEGRGYARSDLVDPIDGRKAWQYMNRRSYGLNSYTRPSASLRTVEGLIGEKTMIRAMRTYAERYRFRHPKPRQFYDTVIDAAPESERATVREVLRLLFETTEAMDFGVYDIETARLPKRDPQSKDEATLTESIVTFRRYGGVRIPMDLQVYFEDGTLRTFRWELDDRVVATDDSDEPDLVTPTRDEQARYVKLRFLGASPVSVAEVDPRTPTARHEGRRETRYALDRDRTNDSLSTTRDERAAWGVALRALGWVQMNTTFYGGM